MRRGCHLCHAASGQLSLAQKRHGFLLSEVDVDADPGLEAQYGKCVPVVTVNGRLRFRGRVNEVLLARILWAEEQAGSHVRPERALGIPKAGCSAQSR
jgi:hypothetical protein